MVILERRDVLGFSSLLRQCNSDSRNGATSSFFTFMQPPEAASQIYVPAVPAVKTSVGAVVKNT